MRYQGKIFLLAIALIPILQGFSCDNFLDVPTAYPEALNYVDAEIDHLLGFSEECLFTGDFREALTATDRVEMLLPLTFDKNDHRKMRLMFDRALIVTCIEGPSENSHQQIAKFNSLLTSKSCGRKANDSQEDLFDQNGHWPVVNSGPISVSECLSRVEDIEAVLRTACSSLAISDVARALIDATIAALGTQARRCCTQEGFWITCIQPLVDTWKRADVFGIPPDPYWD